MTKITYIPGEIANAAIDEHGNRKPVTRTQHIFDDAKGKSQSEVNADVDDSLADRYTKAETYSKTQLDNMITTPETTYKDYDTYADMVAETVHPAGAIYRVANYDGTQAVTNKYAEYSWDGTQYKLMAVRDHGIDDVPTAGSKNLVESGGVDMLLSAICGFDSLEDITFTANNGYVNNDGTKINNSIGCCSDPISVVAGDILMIQTSASQTMSAIASYNDGLYTSLVVGKSSSHKMADYLYVVEENAQLVISCYTNEQSKVVIKKASSYFGLLKDITDSLKTDIQNVSFGSGQKVSTVNIGTSVFDANKILLSTVIKSYFDTIANFAETKFSSMQYTTEKYIKENGSIGSSNAYFYTEPFSVQKGDVLYFRLSAGPSCSALSKYNEGANYRSLIMGNTSAHVMGTYMYVVEEDTQVAFSGFKAEISDSFVYKANAESLVGYIFHVIDNFKNDINVISDNIKTTLSSLSGTTEGGYINSTTGGVRPLSAGFYTAPVPVRAGDILFINISAGPSIAALSQYNGDGLENTVLVIGNTTHNTMGTYMYVVEEDMQVVFSGYKAEIADSYFYIYTANSIVGLLAYYTNPVSVKSEIYNNINNIVESVGINIFTAYDNIVAVGDSLTYSQVYTSANGSRRAYNPWPKQLAKLCGITNSAIYARPGDNSIDAWNRWKNDFTVPQDGKTLAIIYLGTNGWIENTLDTSAPAADVATYATSWADDYVGCLAKIIQTFINLGAKILIVRPRSGGTGGAPEGWTLADTNAAIMTVINRFKCGYVDAKNCHSVDLKYHYYPDLSGSNTVHYNDLGYAMFASKLIQETGKMGTDYMKYLIPV